MVQIESCISSSANPGTTPLELEMLGAWGNLLSMRIRAVRGKGIGRVEQQGLQICQADDFGAIVDLREPAAPVDQHRVYAHSAGAQHVGPMLVTHVNHLAGGHGNPL